MSSIAPAANTVDWLSGTWSSIQGSSGSGNAIVDAASSSGGTSNSIGAGLDDSDFNALSSTLTSVAQNFVQQQNVLVAQEAVARVQNEVAAKLKAVSQTGNFVNKTA